LFGNSARQAAVCFAKATRRTHICKKAIGAMRRPGWRFNAVQGPPGRIGPPNKRQQQGNASPFLYPAKQNQPKVSQLAHGALPMMDNGVFETCQAIANGQAER
jgi:hypothetical protein